MPAATARPRNVGIDSRSALDAGRDESSSRDRAGGDVRAGVVAGLATSLLFTLSWPPFGAWPLAFVALAPLAWWARRARRPSVVMLVTFVTQLPAWAVLEWWIADLTGPGYALLCAYVSSYIALFAGLLWRFAASDRYGRWPAALVVPIAFAAIEFLRTTLVLGGYPWFQLGVPLAGAADSSGMLAQSASIVGSHGLTILAASASGAIVDLVERRGAAVWVAIAVALLQAANAGFGWYVQARSATRPGPTVLAVQTNLSVSNKMTWPREQQVEDVQGYLQQTYDGVIEAKKAGTPADVAVWPETMVPGFGLEEEAIALCERLRAYPGGMYADALHRLRENIGIPLFVGSSVRIGLRLDGELWASDRHYNSAYLIDGPPPHRRYDKLVLTPFGEEMPLISRWDWLERQLLAIGAPGMAFDLDAGERPVRFDLPFAGGGTCRVATPICFEDTVGWLCRELCYEHGEKVADLMINLSNDGWFGGSQGGREQHVLHARLRAIELAVPMVRCANSGLSVLIDDRGRVVRWIGDPAPGRGTMSGTLLAPVQLCDRSTLYGRVGDVWPWLALGAAALMTATARPRVKRADE